MCSRDSRSSNRWKLAQRSFKKEPEDSSIDVMLCKVFNNSSPKFWSPVITRKKGLSQLMV